MEKIISKITLNVSGKNEFSALTAKQYDNGTRAIQAVITDNGKPIAIEAGSIIIANFSRQRLSTDRNISDYKRAYNGEIVDCAGGKVQIPLDYWMLERAGQLSVDVSIIGSDIENPTRLTTTAFSVTIFPANFNGRVSEGEDENYDALTGLLKEVTLFKSEITETLQTAVSSAEANEARREGEYATLKSHMESVFNEAEISAASAEASATAARGSATAAALSERNAATSETNAGGHAASASESRAATDTAISQFTTFLAEERVAIESAESLAQTHESNAASEANRAAQYADSAREKAESANTALAETNATVGEFSAHMARVKESIETSERNAEAYKDASSASASAAQRSEESAQTQAAFVSDTADEINSTVTTFRAWVSEQESTISADRQIADQSKSDAEASATTAAQFADNARESAESANTALAEANATVGEFSAHLETENANIAQSVATASSHATVATDKAAEAAQSATNAELSANAASASATDAESSASRASQEAIAAESSATSAATEKSELETVIADFRQWFTEEKHNMGGSIVTIIEAQNIDIGELFAQYGTGLFLWEYDGVRGFVGCDKYAPLSVHAKSCYLFVFEMNEQQVGWYLFDNYEQTLFNDVSIPEGFTYGFYNLQDGTGTFITDIGVTLYQVTSDLQGLMEDKRFLVRISDMNSALETKLDKVEQSGVVYINSADGVPDSIAFSQNADAETIAQRGVNGVLSVGAPTAATHAANKGYVDSVAEGKLSNADIVNAETYVDFFKTVTFKSTVNLDAYPTESMHAVNKQYVDDCLMPLVMGRAALAPVAESGSYEDLSDTPSIPTKVSELINDAGYLTTHQDISGKSNVGHTHSASEVSGLATVATSGSYTDLSNKPTIPTVNNATLTIQKNGTNVATFTANASSNVTANISVPTKTSQLTNDSGFLTSHQDISGKSNVGHTHTASQVSGLATVATSGSYNDLSNKPTIPSNNNQLTNGAGYITASGSCNYASSAGNADTLDGYHASSFSLSGHTHSYLPTSGGTVKGAITFGTSDSYGIRTTTNNYCRVGESGYAFYQIYGTSIYATSDRRFKHDIEDCKLDCWSVIDKLPVREFVFNQDKDNHKSVGIIAQELQEALPDEYHKAFISEGEDENKYLSVNDGKMVYLLLAALKEEHKKVLELEAKVNGLLHEG